MKIAACTILAAVLTLAACAAEPLPHGDRGRPDVTTTPPEEPGPDRAVPAGAIQVDDDIYMVPAGRDPDGCAWFTPFSRTKMVAAVLYYRDRSGGFTMRKSEAACD